MRAHGGQFHPEDTDDRFVGELIGEPTDSDSLNCKYNNGDPSVSALVPVNTGEAMATIINSVQTGSELQRVGILLVQISLHMTIEEVRDNPEEWR